MNKLIKATTVAIFIATIVVAAIIYGVTAISLFLIHAIIDVGNLIW